MLAASITMFVLALVSLVRLLYCEIEHTGTVVCGVFNSQDNVRVTLREFELRSAHDGEVIDV